MKEFESIDLLLNQITPAEEKNFEKKYTKVALSTHEKDELKKMFAKNMWSEEFNFYSNVPEAELIFQYRCCGKDIWLTIYKFEDDQ